MREYYSCLCPAVITTRISTVTITALEFSFLIYKGVFHTLSAKADTSVVVDCLLVY